MNTKTETNTNLFRKWASIEQFSNVVKQVRQWAKYHGVALPTITYKGSVKLHGTNAAIVLHRDANGEISVHAQSRERMLTIESDNAGFCLWVMHNKEAFNEWAEIYLNWNETLYVYGEWCGGTIQKGVALNQLEKHFALFSRVVIDRNGDEYWGHCHSFSTIETTGAGAMTKIDEIVEPLQITVDFNDPGAVQAFLFEETMKVETECPYAKAFGVSGIGEGLVWTPMNQVVVEKDDGTEVTLPTILFKTKGEKHSASKVKVVKEITSAEIEARQNVKEFLDDFVTENRLSQGFDKLTEMGLSHEMKNLGAYLKWVSGDVLREGRDVIEASMLDPKEICKAIPDIARKYFMNRLASE
jgi:hypothetical protein